MKILYGKIGRAFNIDTANTSTLGGDADVVNLLWRLAEWYPDDEIILLGRNSRDGVLPPNVTNPWITYQDVVREEMKAAGVETTWTKTGKSKQLTTETMLKSVPILQRVTDEIVGDYADVRGVVLWLGQHGTSNWPLPMTDGSGTLTCPQDAFFHYSGHLLYAVNRWRDLDPVANEEVWLCPDVRNYWKGRDTKWPLRRPVLAQYDTTHQVKHYRYGDTTPPWGGCAEWGDGYWQTNMRMEYSGLELTALPPRRFASARDPLPPLAGRKPFGMIVNENRRDCRNNRLDIMCEWLGEVLDGDIEIFGTWSEQSQKILGRPVSPVLHDEMYSKLASWRCTFTTPASGSGWATAKPWEAFAVGTICFFHPAYDDQNHILRDADPNLAHWLRPPTPEALWQAVRELEKSDDAYTWLAHKQREHFMKRLWLDQVGTEIRSRVSRTG